MKQWYHIAITIYCFDSETCDKLPTNFSNYTLLVLFTVVINTNFLAKYKKKNPDLTITQTNP